MWLQWLYLHFRDERELDIAQHRKERRLAQAFQVDTVKAMLVQLKVKQSEKTNFAVFASYTF